MAIGQFGTALDEVLKRNGETRGAAGAAAHVDASLIGKIVKGTRKPTKEVMASTTKHYDDGQLYIAAAGEVTQGASVPWLNNVDLHKSSVHIKTLEEIQEALDSLQRAPITKTKEQLAEADMKQIKLTLMECVEAITALTHYVAILCKEYCFSWMGVWKEHRAYLKSKKYLK
ncbi:XRE family transcriptional regulator [Paenibacillus sp. VCA1]|uniref:XRE family transcriptional regulator n=1 Tax=Paenibacillus sp. VCA1 TaxID=3039148 RepID=UPI002871D65B|nr:XRE family transcriptional regulator [Paenibacillus sp. VCA1]MDR9857840.1 XRE family transcriptional regulator [Paenibacillus sp. VCA1]